MKISQSRINSTASTLQRILYCALRRDHPNYTSGDLTTLTQAFVLWYLCWIDFGMTFLELDVVWLESRICNVGTLNSWAQKIAHVEFKDLQQRLEAADLKIIQVSDGDFLQSLLDAIGELDFPGKASYIRAILLGRDVNPFLSKQDVSSFLVPVRSLLNLLKRIPLSTATADWAGWLQTEQFVKDNHVSDFMLGELRKAALLPNGRGENYFPSAHIQQSVHFPSGSVSDVEGARGQPALKCQAKAYASRDSYRTITSHDVYWPGTKCLDEHYPDRPVGKGLDVPKTWKTRRLIVKEPAYQSWLQHMIQESLCEAVHMRWGRHVHPHRQDHNRFLCQSREYATIDSSNASDTVSWRIAKAVLPYDWYRLLRASRSELVDIPYPKGKIQRVQLAKAAGMGCGWTFVLECHVFASIIEFVIQEEGFDATLDWGVFGDDIILPVAWYEATIKWLKFFGFQPNESKSWSEPYAYRESCGVEYINACYHDFGLMGRINVTQLGPVGRINITPLRLSRRFDESAYAYYQTGKRLHSAVLEKGASGKPTPKEILGLMALVNLADSCYLKGFFLMYRYLADGLRVRGAVFSYDWLIVEDDHSKEIVYTGLFSPTAEQSCPAFVADIEPCIKPLDESCLLQWALSAPTRPLERFQETGKRFIRDGKGLQIPDGICQHSDYPWLSQDDLHGLRPLSRAEVSAIVADARVWKHYLHKLRLQRVQAKNRRGSRVRSPGNYDWNNEHWYASEFRSGIRDYEVRLE